LTTVLTLSGIALVVFVFAAVLMLAHGVEVTLVDTGDDANIIALRRSANAELMSQISRDGAKILEDQPEIALQGSGQPLATSDVYVIINLLRKKSNDMGNVTVRGVSPGAMNLRSQVKLTAGRTFAFGSHEIILGSSIAKRFQGTDIGQILRFGDADWTVVGTFDGGNSGYDSEIWGDVEQMMPAFGRPVFSSVTLRLKNPSDFTALKDRIAKDPRTQYIELKREKDYYRDQSRVMSDFIKVLGLIVTIIFSVGAIVGAMITMYAAVANRTVEIGTLRALGFRRRSILGAFLIESILLAIIGGIAGLVLASLMSFVQISTVNFGTFSELAFGFALSPSIIISSMVFSLIMGIVGGFLPAARASRMNILAALRSA
jgi:ABC-type lipoprotein release transport system permease subunit